MIFNPQKQKESAYRTRISELHSELEVRARELNVVTSQHDILSREVKTLLLKKESLLAYINQLTADIMRLNDSLAGLRATHRKEMEEHGQIVTDRQLEIKNLKSTIATLVEKVNTLQKEKDAFEDLSGKLTSATDDYQETLKKNLSLKSQNSELAHKNELALHEVEEREKLISEKVKKDGEILTQTEDNLRIIEVYARRLQMFYDENGMDIDVLSKFNIKRDNNI